MPQDYIRPSSLEEAMAIKAAKPEAVFLAGGTCLLAGDSRKKPDSLIDVGRILPRGIEHGSRGLVIGAGATFQDLVDSRSVPPALRDAALSMINRNVRNRATVGGNLGAGKSCASLVPLFIVLGARVKVLGPKGPHGALAMEWMAIPRGLLLEVELELKPGTWLAFARHSRTSCDLSVLTCAVAYGLDAEKRLDGLKVALGGLGPHAREFPDLAGFFEGQALPGKAAIEERARTVFSPRTDFRGSAAFKSVRAAALLADALHSAEEIT